MIIIDLSGYQVQVVVQAVEKELEEVVQKEEAVTMNIMQWVDQHMYEYDL